MRSEGLVEMFFVSTGGMEGTFPHLGLMYLRVFIGSKEGALKDAVAVEAAIHHTTVREMKKVGIMPLVHYVSTPMQMVTKEAIDDPSDPKGMNTRVMSPMFADMVSLLNGVPIVMGVTETYLALQRGVVDAVITGVAAMNSLSLFEVVDYLYLYNFAPSVGYTSVNIEAYEALPK